jgi:hypothetical protein
LDIPTPLKKICDKNLHQNLARDDEIAKLDSTHPTMGQ